MKGTSSPLEKAVLIASGMETASTEHSRNSSEIFPTSPSFEAAIATSLPSWKNEDQPLVSFLRFWGFDREFWPASEGVMRRAQRRFGLHFDYETTGEVLLWHYTDAK
mmetsp:Transcript_13975/g.18587  ORF Transcript_13975/g.18587 Transcript_13975/m.18587 type:complete len:107 (+) Transcript_13975:1110-1430(+)